jgi:hypothetical protein
MWVRSTAASHGFVFDRCRFETAGGGAAGAYLARKHGRVSGQRSGLIACALGAINPVGVDAARPTPRGMRYWEFASTSSPPRRSGRRSTASCVATT